MLREPAYLVLGAVCLPFLLLGLLGLHDAIFPAKASLRDDGSTSADPPSQIPCDPL